MKIKFDFRSIRFRLWLTFLGFALLILGLIWCLQILFMNTYYEEMKTSETSKIAATIKTSYAANNYSIESLQNTIDELANENDVTILILDSSGEYMINTDERNLINFRENLPERYASDIAELYVKLQESKFGSASNISTGRMNNRTMEFASYLTNAAGENEYIMFLFSPLFPVQSTVSILRSQLVYITIIAILLALAMSLLLANRIARPIKQITRSAAEMGKGNYGVKFQGGHFTEIDELAETLTKAEGELEKTDMYQKDLIANVSHDLRTPLTMIKSYGEMIRDLSGDNPEKRNAHLAVIIEETDRLNSLVNDMLNLSRMQSRKIALEMEPFDFVHTVEATMSSYDILSENEGYRFEFTCDPGPLIVHADEAKIRQVMANLINNAVKYCGEDKLIQVEVKRNGRKVRFSVTDHGQGIAPDEITHVWERYYKSSTHHVRSTEGSGLGLSIVKEILNLHKADFDVESELGKGSTFWFELALMKPKKPAVNGPTLNR